MPPLYRPLLIALLFAAASCQRAPTPAPVSDLSAPAPAPSSSPEPVASEPAPDPVPAVVAPAAPDDDFDIASVPLSTVPLGDWPYVGMPEGYALREMKDMRFELAPFWTGNRIEWVEGRVREGLVISTDGRGYAPREITHNLDALVQQLGGVRVVDARPFSEEARAAAKAKDRHSVLFYGLLSMTYAPATTWVVRREDRAIWMQFLAGMREGSLLIAESAPFKPTASLLAASQLKQALDSTGKVALQVHFATDKTDILPESQPQIAQVVQLLKDDPALKLAVNGHTDNSGDAAHNQTLSEGRARSVVAALTAQGIDAARLVAAGFGDTRPVADNATADGKAKNRRVELVKQP